MSPSVNASTWQVQGGEATIMYRLARTYHFSGLPPPNATGILRITCTLESSVDVNWINSSLHVNMRPFDFPPSKTLVMGLFTTDAKGGLLEVQAIPARPEWKNDNVLDGVFAPHEDDVPKCLRALSSGNELFFALFKPKQPDLEPVLDQATQPLFRLQLPNDLEFKRLYDETYERVARDQDATRARQLSEGWYRRRTF